MKIQFSLKVTPFPHFPYNSLCGSYIHNRQNQNPPMDKRGIQFHSPPISIICLPVIQLKVTRHLFRNLSNYLFTRSYPIQVTAKPNLNSYISLFS
jgi:hypothetical protein